MSHVYDEAFYEYLNDGALRTARIVTSFLRSELKIESAVDFGCGQGAWPRAWLDSGVDAYGVDGNYVDRDSLLIPRDRFTAHDLSRPFELSRTYDLAESLEVAEHLPERCAQRFVGTLCEHADIVLFAAAIPGQGGEFHVNEQPLGYWRAIFADYGYQPFDCIRPLLADQEGIPFWYRYNTLLYVKEGVALSPVITRTRIPEAQSVPEVAPIWFRARCATVRMLPGSSSHNLAVAKKHVANVSRKLIAGRLR